MSYLKAVIITLLCIITHSTYALDSENEEKVDAPVIFSGSSNIRLAEKIAKNLGVPLGKIHTGKFNDGEISLQIDQSVRNQDVFVLQSTCRTATDSVNDSIMELYLLIRTLKRSSAKTVNVIVPYFGYARQDRKTSSRVPISASDVAMLLESAGADRVLAVDLHCGQIQGFFHQTPVDNLYASTSMVPYFLKKDLENVVIVSPDAGGVGRAKQFNELLLKGGVEGDIAMIIKQRSGAGKISSMHLVGDVRGADVIIVDDLCDTAGTLVKAAQLLKDSGAHRVFAAISHPVFSGPALDRIRDSVIIDLVTTDTIPLCGDIPENITQISLAPLLADAIDCIYRGRSTSHLFL